MHSRCEWTVVITFGEEVQLVEEGEDGGPVDRVSVGGV
jgi:hypothetical protein